MTNENLEAALEYARIGVPVFPCRIRPEGKKKAKSPYPPNGFKDASTGTEQIKCWWANHPDAIIGMPTGKISGLIVIDIDPRHGGDHSFQGLIDEHGKLPETLTAITGGGGTHYYFRCPNTEIRCSNSKLASGVDVKADGGYVILPPSGHESGKSYFWDGDFALDAVAEMPQWLLKLIETASQKKTPASSADGNDIQESERNDALASLAGTMRNRGMGEQEVLAAILTTNRLRCKPPLPETEVEAIAKSICRYEPDQAVVIATEGAPDVDLSGIMSQFHDEEEPDYTATYDPGEIPKHLLSVPGFINDVCDFMLQTAPHPEPILSFFGALCLQSVLAGRKVRDAQDNRTNLYILNLAYPGCGKDQPRKVNSEILKAVGLATGTADGFASGEAIEDKMLISPATLFQTDEVDTIITSMSGGRDSRIEMITHVLLKFFSAANALYLARLKAGQKETSTIDQPSLTIYGTAVPENYYQALSNKMLTNGFFARMLVFESGARTPEQDFTTLPIPDSIYRMAKYWAEFLPGEGNLASFHPIPLLVEHTPEAKQLQRDYGRKADEQYDKAQEHADLVTMAMWGRASEKARRLSLIYACSENPFRPKITPQAVQWASQMVDYATSRMLFMASQYVSESEFHANCQKLLRVLRDWKAKKGNAWMPFYRVNQKLPWTERDHIEVRTTLVNQRRIEYFEQKTGGPQKRLYRISEP
jgi:hypothetical protein